jgi:hypothetical protein
MPTYPTIYRVTLTDGAAIVAHHIEAAGEVRCYRVWTAAPRQHSRWTPCDRLGADAAAVRTGLADAPPAVRDAIAAAPRR